MELELKQFSGLEIKDADKGEVSAIVATLNVVDGDGDVILPGAVPDGTKVKMSSYGHSIDPRHGGEAPVGKGTLATVGDKLVYTGRFFISTDRGREAFNQTKEMGSDQEWSFGFPPSSVVRAPITEPWLLKGARRVIQKLGALEVSPVFLGAGKDTQTLSMKSAGLLQADVQKEFVRFQQLQQRRVALAGIV